MEPILTKQDVFDLLKTTWQHWNDRPLEYPHFLLELEYIDFFSLLITQLHVEENDNIVPVVNCYLDAAQKHSIKQICSMMEYQNSDGTAIWNLMSEKQLIVKRDQKIYKKQVPVKTRKELKKEYWMDYNHWILAKVCWNGLLDSQNPDFRIIITSSVAEDSEDPIDVLLAQEYKPLWGVWTALNTFGRPLTTFENFNDSVCVRPYAALVRYSKATGKRVNFVSHLNSFSTAGFL